MAKLDDLGADAREVLDALILNWCDDHISHHGYSADVMLDGMHKLFEAGIARILMDSDTGAYTISLVDEATKQLDAFFGVKRA